MAKKDIKDQDGSGFLIIATINAATMIIDITIATSVAIELLIVKRSRSWVMLSLACEFR